MIQMFDALIAMVNCGEATGACFLLAVSVLMRIIWKVDHQPQRPIKNAKTYEELCKHWYWNPIDLRNEQMDRKPFKDGYSWKEQQSKPLISKTEADLPSDALAEFWVKENEHKLDPISIELVRKRTRIFEADDSVKEIKLNEYMIQDGKDKPEKEWTEKMFPLDVIYVGPKVGYREAFCAAICGRVAPEGIVAEFTYTWEDKDQKKYDADDGTFLKRYWQEKGIREEVFKGRTKVTKKKKQGEKKEQEVEKWEKDIPALTVEDYPLTVRYNKDKLDWDKPGNYAIVDDWGLKTTAVVFFYLFIAFSPPFYKLFGWRNPGSSPDDTMGCQYALNSQYWDRETALQPMNLFFWIAYAVLSVYVALWSVDYLLWYGQKQDRIKDSKDALRNKDMRQGDEVEKKD